MEKQDLKNLLENIYHLLAEEAPPPPPPPPPPKQEVGIGGPVIPRYAPGTSPYEQLSFWDIEGWDEQHPGSRPSGPGPWPGNPMGEWWHPGMNEGQFELVAVRPDSWPQWQYPFGHDGPPLPPGDFLGSGQGGQWVFGMPPDGGYYYIYPEGKDGLHRVFQWNGEWNGGFQQLPSWGYPS